MPAPDVTSVRAERRTARELARTQATASEQAHTIALQAEQIDALSQELDAARAIAQGVHEDARWLATQVALTYRVKGWTGYTGQVRDVVERYVRTGH
ncbi:hypothetical protein HF995_13525 [Sanguibacter hominis ATCC BAA-789]|uniref:Uncharacterized protein n=1 Tax=Sanguibacter hominis ATCC BAA-789 TaxID=1312740 RepID=A0A9X5FHE0_9MICO|nr:hypothetical protein [Sanguibacter hominis]NKX94276.1 hypothetical protein [Sanguibacter hominis ATCC BAA-789]